MKLIKNLWNILNQKNPKEMDNFIFAKLWRDHDNIKSELIRIEQDQYSKAHLDECRRLEDRITSAFIEWEKTIDAFHQRIKNLEDKA